MAIDGTGIGLQQDMLLVGTHDITVYARDAYPLLDGIWVKEHSRLLSCTETVAENLFPVCAQLAVALAISQRCDSANMLC